MILSHTISVYLRTETERNSEISSFLVTKSLVSSEYCPVLPPLLGECFSVHLPRLQMRFVLSHIKPIFPKTVSDGHSTLQNSRGFVFCVLPSGSFNQIRIIVVQLWARGSRLDGCKRLIRWKRLVRDISLDIDVAVLLEEGSAGAHVSPSQRGVPLRKN